MDKFKKIVLNVPHASDEFPRNLWDGDIFKHVEDLTDWYTDEIFKPLFDVDGVKMVRFPYSRFYCDAERLEKDPMESVGQGIYYTHYKDCTRAFNEAEHNEVMKCWKEHQLNLSSEIVDGSLLIDCHSFTDDGSGIDICIGFNDDWSKPSDEVIELMKNHFEGYLGMNVGINKPYANSITPKCDIPYKSLMIEVNKRRYLNGDRGFKASAYKLHDHINNLYLKLIE